MKNIFLLIAFSVILTGCYNNAHLRTQHALKDEETVFSASSTLNITGEAMDYALQTPGALGLRGEISYLRGKPWGELGLFGGIGFGSEGETIGYTGGLDLRKYSWTKKGMGLKMGGQAEITLLPQSDRYYRSTHGYGIHFRPSITTITTKNNDYYVGFHGLYSLSQMSSFDYINYYENGLWQYIEDDIAHTQITSGIGLTLGGEFPSRKSALQIVINGTLASGRSIVHDYTDILVDENSYSTFVVSGSVGLNFYKPRSVSVSTQGPSPPPVPLQKQQVPMLFDPTTGEIIESKTTGVEFDPLTGEPVESPPNVTPLPMTFLGGRMADIKLIDGSLYSKVKLQSISSEGITFLYDKKSRSPLGRRTLSNTTVLIPLVQMNSIIIYEGNNSVGKGVSGCLAGCAIGYCGPLLISLITGVDELGGFVLFTVPLGIVYGWTNGIGEPPTRTVTLTGLTLQEKFYRIVKSLQ